MRKTCRIILWIVTGWIALGVAGVAYYRSIHPYGQSHCCILAINMALEDYANEHSGCYPAGESTPEASLNLLYKSGCD
jgi:hypothetical protein